MSSTRCRPFTLIAGGWGQPLHPAGDTVRYHVRTGGHAITAYNWVQYLDFADRHLQAPH